MEKHKGSSDLRQSVSLFQAAMYGIGLILGAGIYVLIGDVAGIAGNGMWISFAIAAIIAAFTGISYAELSSMFPKSAAEYVFVKNAFQNNGIAFVAGWLIIFVALVSAAAVAVGFAGYFASFVPQLDKTLIALALVGILSAVNFIGIRESVWANTTFTIIEVAGLAAIVAAAMMFGNLQIDFYEIPSASSGSLSLSIGAILSAAGLVFFAYFGFENLANIAEETKNARKVIPRALVLSIVVTTAIYIVVAISALSLVGWEELSTSSAPLALAAEKAFGNSGILMLSIIALFATSNTVLMMLISGSRIIYGMSSGSALPESLSRTHHITKTPWVAVAVAGAASAAVVLASGASIESIARIAVFGIFLVYTMVNLSLIWLRYRQPALDRPFRSPITVGGKFPLLAGLGLATSLGMLSQFDFSTATFGAIAAGVGVIFYFALKKARERGGPVR